VRPQGLLSRLAKWLIERLVRSGSVRIEGLPAGGKPVVTRQVYGSWDDVPPEVQAEIARARTGTAHSINFVDHTTGEHRTFRSWDEVPAELRDKIPPEMREKMAADLEAALHSAGDPEADPDRIVVQEATCSKVIDFKIDQVRRGD
jgi:hypothetical protein